MYSIIGGGLGGLVTAYELAKEGVPCALYEAKAQCGGRILTDTRYTKNGQFVEKGGEFIDSEEVHPAMHRLVQELGVELEDIKTGRGEDEYFVQGVAHSAEEVTATLRPLMQRLQMDLEQAQADPAFRLHSINSPLRPMWRHAHRKWG
jgi:monoamine oxidase